MSNNKNKKLKKPNVQMNEKEKESIQEFKDAKNSWKEKMAKVSKNPVMAVIIDLLKLFALLFIIELMVVIVPTTVNMIGELIGVGTSDATSTSNYMVLWQGYNTFAILCEFYIMINIIKPIWNSLSVVKKHKEKKQHKKEKQ